MAKNEFKAFATGNGANIITQSEYEQLAVLASGFFSGKASSAQINKAIRQGTFVSSAVSQFVSDSINEDVNDDGVINNYIRQLINAIHVESSNAVSGGLGSDVIGRFVGVKTITSSSTYIKPENVKFVVVNLVGGGGAGGSPAQNGAGYSSGGGGGNSGCHARAVIDIRGVPSILCIVGAGGIASENSTGGQGGSSSFGSYISVFGGNGGQLLESSTDLNRIYGMSPLRDVYGSIRGGVTLMEFDAGRLGGDAIILSSGSRAGFGGASALGGNTFGPGIDIQGIAGSTYGGGGSGAVATNASSGTFLLGGDGAGGVIMIEEYA